LISSRLAIDQVDKTVVDRSLVTKKFSVLISILGPLESFATLATTGKSLNLVVILLLAYSDE